MKKQNLFSLALVFALGLLLWMLPTPAGLRPEAWHLFALFVPTILGIILKPLPMSALILLSLTVATLTCTLSLQEALSGFQNPISWLVVFAFFISRGLVKTGLGSRIAYYFISLLGKNTLGMSYGLLLSELVLAPAIPSVTARTGGILFPVIQSLARSFGSDPAQGTERRIGAFLMKVAYQGSVLTSAMFLTAMASNPLFAGITQEAGYSISWMTWAIGGIVPGLLSLLIMPFAVYRLYPPEIKKTPDATRFAQEKLREMGPLRKEEWVMSGIFGLLLFLWIGGNWMGINATVAALVGLSCMLLFDILNWSDCLKESAAWDTFVWFSALMMFAAQLNSSGLTPWLSQQIVPLVHGMPWLPAFIILGLIYFYSHYFFASNAAHVCAMYLAFLGIAISLGTPPALAILVFAYASNLMGGLTHYGSGPAPIYYGSGYIEVKAWWRVGFLLSVINLLIWMGLGPLWWRVAGLW